MADIYLRVIKENPKVVQDYLNCNENSINFLVGQAMRYANGEASPNICLKIIRQEIHKQYPGKHMSMLLKKANIDFDIKEGKELEDGS